jgi:hypothetical protein
MNKIQSQGSGWIGDILYSETSTDNPEPTIGCDEFNLCITLINYTDGPYLTFEDAHVQLILNLDQYEIINDGVFVNIGTTNGLTTFEVIQDIKSINDPNFEEGFYSLCIKVRTKAAASPKSGFSVRIDLGNDQLLEYDSGFINFSNLNNQIGVDISSVTYLSDIATNWTAGSTVPGYLLHSYVACNNGGGNGAEYSEQVFILHGTLVVDRDYCFYGRIYMDDGAIIQVEPNITCNIGQYVGQDPVRTVIDACGKMWRMIDVKHDATLNVSNADINNALYGTYLNNRATVNTNSTTMYYNNYIGIYNNLEDASSFANIKSTTFEFSGAFKENCWNCSGLRLFDRTYAGINLGKSQINGSSLQCSSLLNGVKVYNSMVNIQGGLFEDIRDYGTPDNGDSNGKGISSRGLPSTTKIEDVTFDNCNWGIYTRGVNCDAVGNVMTNVLTGMQFDHSPGRDFNVIHNFPIDAENMGINFCWTGAVNSTYVTENEVTLTGANSIGIELNQMQSYNNVVTNNEVYIGPGFIGIDHNSSVGGRIDHNSVFSNSTSAVENVGIAVQGGSDVVETCNWLSSSMVCANKGILVSQSANNLCAGNEAEDWHYDYHYVGTNSGTQYLGNIMDDANHGLCLGIPLIGGAIIGVQEHAGNKWVGSYAGKAAKNYGTSQDMDKSLFIINAQDQQHPEYRPENFNELVNDGWFAHDPDNALELDCPNGIGSYDHPRVFPRSEDYLIASHGLDYGSVAGSRIWTSERQLYREIGKQEEFSNLPNIYQDFYNDNIETTVGQFEEIEKLIQTAFSNTENFNDSIKANIIICDSIVDEVLALYEELETESDSSTRVQIQADISDYKDILDSLIELRIELNEELVDSVNIIIHQAWVLNENIETDTFYDAYQKFVNGIYLNALMTNEWTIDSIDRLIIDSIASQCVLLGGDAVYRARALSSLYCNIRFNDDSICDHAFEQHSSKMEKILSNGSLFIHPNPVSDLLCLNLSNLDDQIVLVKIVDMTGKTIFDAKPISTGNQFTLSVKELRPGVFVSEVFLSNGLKFCNKFIKI